jgi:hypothetical protein
MMGMPKWADNRWIERESGEAVIIAAIANDPVVSAFTTPQRSQIEFTEIVS